MAKKKPAGVRFYRALGRVCFNAGAVLALTDGQADRRRHLLEPAGKGLYRVRDGARVEFKGGEEIGTTADQVNKAALALLVPDEPAPPAGDAPADGDPAGDAPAEDDAGAGA